MFVSIAINCHVVFNLVVSATTTTCIATTTCTVDIMPTSVITQGSNVWILLFDIMLH